MRKNVLRNFGIIFLIFLFLIGGIFAIYSRSAVQQFSPGNSFTHDYGQGVNIDLVPSFGDDICSSGQDFIIQIPPLGCEPAVVRSDLLEEQEVPVFCKLSATQLNPLIDVNAIEYIEFNNEYPDGVRTIGFHPARAAIKGTERTLLNSPILENVGYAVIVLNQYKNESSMPDWIEGEMTAKISYDVQNAFGIGRGTYHLPVLDDNEWREKYSQYGFWNGKGFLRAKAVSDDQATIAVYANPDQQISSSTLDVGADSEEIFLPGFYCMAGLKLRLRDLEDPSTMVRLNVGGDVYDVSEGEKFLDNSCTLKDIQKQGLVERASISCGTDEGIENFDLDITPEVRVDINGNVKNLQIGDEMHSFGSSSEKKVYLGYVGELNGDYFIIPVVSPDRTSEDFLNSAYFRIFLPSLVKSFSYDTSSSIVDIAKKIGVTYYGAFIGAGVSLFSGTYPLGLYFVEGSSQGTVLFDTASGFSQFATLETSRPKITFMGFKEPENKAFSDIEFKDNFDNALKDYEVILESFSGEKDTTSTETYGEGALFQALNLCKQTQQIATLKRLCLEYRDNYKDNINIQNLCEYSPIFSNSKISSNGVMINGKLMMISLEGIFQPSPDDYGVEFILEDAGDFSGKKTLQKGDILYVSDDEFISLSEIREDVAIFDIRGVKGTEMNAGATEWSKRYAAKLLEEVVEAGIYSSNTAEIPEGGYKVFGDKSYRITVTKINLNKNVRVDVIPNIQDLSSEANFTFKIGIEKRAIQLSPKQARDLIKSLDEQIKTWKQISEGLGTAVKTMKGACLGVGAIMTVKSFISNTDGKAIARQDVMQGESGWLKFCQDEFAKGDKKYNSVDHCLLTNNNAIESDVNAMTEIMNSQANIDEENLAQRLSDIRGEVGVLPVAVQNGLTIDGSQTGLFTSSQLMDLERYSLIENSDASPRLKALATAKKQNLIQAIEERSQEFNRLQESARQAKMQGIGEGIIRVIPTEKTVMAVYDGAKAKAGNVYGFAPGTEYQKFSYDGVSYVASLNNLGDRQYSLNKDQFYTLDGEKKDVSQIRGLDKVYFKLYSDVSYHNPINPIDLNVKYFQIAPYKGLPALVPFDKDNGWYVRMKPTVSGFGGIRAYDDSGRVVSFELCNVMDDNSISSDSDSGDDQCMKFNPGLGEIYGEFPGLNPADTQRIVRCAVDAIEQASQQADSERISIRTGCGSASFPKGNPAVAIPEMQCQNFMSPKDCTILFNVCDPVICPPSRCNFGGTNYVDDVIQSGIIGSILLCLPNIKEKIVVPICLTGVQAGVDGITSVMQAYRDCLDDNLKNGETVGICDEIHSVYLCEMFWRQGLPFAKTLLPKVLGAAFGEGGTRGGGEYMNVASAWQNAENSFNYFTQYYGKNSYNAFKIRSMEDVGTEVCRASLSTAYPSGIDFFNNLIEPDSPVQYHGRFDEIPFTTGTVPPISQYKVFYHIFAGKDAGAYYQIYLKSSSSGFYGDNPKLVIDSGYVPRGEYKDETKDLTAPAGYGEMCIVVNGKEDCGFKQISSSFAVDYIEDAYLNEQTKEQVITTEQCESGSASIYGLLSPNLQEGVDDVVNPELYRHGIIRVCATANPGLATDASAGGVESRWKDVGYCDDLKMRCWLDTQSVKDQIKNLDLEKDALKTVTDNYLERLKELGQSMNEEDFVKAQKELNEMFAKGDYLGVINYVSDEIITKALFNSWKAYLHLVRGNSHSELAKLRFEEIRPPAPTSSSTGVQPPSSGVTTPSQFVNVRDKIINFAFSKVGQVCRDTCYTSVRAIYDELKINPKCVYSAGGSAQRSQPKCSSCGCSGEDTCNNCVRNKDDLRKGDLVQIYNANTVSETGGHNFIFESWADKEKKIVNVFASPGSGKPLEYRKNYDISNYEVTVIWEPVDTSSESSIYEDIKNGVDEAFKIDIFPVPIDYLESISWNFGERRREGTRCHAGVDIHTKNGGKVLAVADGEVKNIDSFTDCESGEAVAVIVDHGDFVVNYGEIDSNKIEVEEGDKILSGDTIGYASVCGMLHFELYKKGVTHNIQWGNLPGKVGEGKNYCRENEAFLDVKNKKILDPTNTLLWVAEEIKRSSNSICFESQDSFLNDQVYVTEGCFHWDENKNEWYFIAKGDPERYSLSQILLSSLFTSDEILAKAKELKEQEEEDEIIDRESCGDCGEDDSFWTFGFANICDKDECDRISDKLEREGGVGCILPPQLRSCIPKPEGYVEPDEESGDDDDNDGDTGETEYETAMNNDLGNLNYNIEITDDIVKKFTSYYLSDRPSYGKDLNQVEKEDIVKKILDNSRRYNIPPHLAMAVAEQESTFAPCILGDDNKALGIYQVHQNGLFPDCAQQNFFSGSFSSLRNDLSSGTNCHIPEIVGCGLFGFSEKYKSCSSWESALCSYNTGKCSNEAKDKFCYVQRKDGSGNPIDSDYVFEEVMKHCGGNKNNPGNCFKGYTNWD